MLSSPRNAPYILLMLEWQYLFNWMHSRKRFLTYSALIWPSVSKTRIPFYWTIVGFFTALSISSSLFLTEWSHTAWSISELIFQLTKKKKKLFEHLLKHIISLKLPWCISCWLQLIQIVIIFNKLSIYKNKQLLI